MVAASATAILIDIVFPLAPNGPSKITQNRQSLARQALVRSPCQGTFLTALVNRMVSTHGRQGPASRGNKGNVRNKVNDLKTTLSRKDARAPGRGLTSACGCERPLIPGALTRGWVSRPGHGAAPSGATQTRDPESHRVCRCMSPSSATHREVRAALRPGHETAFTPTSCSAGS